MTISRSILVLLLCLIIGACASSAGGIDSSAPSTASTLQGSRWQLVQIQSMNDEVFTPDQRQKYSLRFEGDGRLVVRADCNRGMGNWSMTPPSGVQFGQLATTRALCPPDSLDQRFLQELGFVRSFIVEDGKLYLATLADGSILVFEPLVL